VASKPPLFFLQNRNGGRSLWDNGFRSSSSMESIQRKGLPMNPEIFHKSGGGDLVPAAHKYLTDRRNFLRTALPAGALCGLGCPKLSALLQEGTVPGQSLQEKAAQDSGMSYEEVFRFAYQGGFIPIAKKMMESMGRDVFLDLLASAASEAASEGVSESMRALAAADPDQSPRNDLSTFADGMRNPDSSYRNALTYEIVEDSDDAFEVKITECLWAKTYRESDASEIGYAAQCHGDHAAAEAFNPRLKLIRSKTLMQGDDCCNHRWVMVE